MAFTSNEVLHIARKIEQNGVAFYQRAAELSIEPAHKKLLLDLAEMEAQHEALFLQMQMELTQNERAGSELDIDEEIALFLDTLAGGHVFNTNRDPGDILTGEESMTEILSTAIGLEKESIVYHSALKEVVADDASRAKVQQVIEEEMQHVALLSCQREALKE